MDDLISRQAAIDAINHICPVDTEYDCTLLDRVDVRYVLLDLPSAQKKGHWRNYEGTLTCSVCETEFDNGIMEYCGDDVPMFCPWCGADMRKEGKTNV